LRNIIEPAKAQMEGEDMPESVEPMIAAPTGRSNEGSDKRVVTVDVSTTKLSEGGGMRRTRIKAKADSS
jgi:hypothetical protein